MQENDYVDDFAEESDTSYPEEKFEAFVSDLDSMLIFGEPIDDQLKLNNSRSFSLMDATTQDTSQSKEFYDNNECYTLEENDFYNESFEAVSPNNENLKEFSSVTFANAKQKSPTKTAKSKMNTDSTQSKKYETNKTYRQVNRDQSKIENQSTDVHTHSSHTTCQQESIKPSGDKTSKNNTKFRRIPINRAAALHGGESMLTPKMNNINVVASVVAADTKHDVFALQKQLASALRRVAAYKQDNDHLRTKLDSANIEASLERYKHLLVEKDSKLMALADENQSLRQIARFQSKGLVKGERERSSQPERELSQDRQIEILVEHVRKVKTKLADCRAREDALAEENGLLREKTAKQGRRITKLRRVVDELKAAMALEKSHTDHTHPRLAEYRPTEDNNALVLVESAGQGDESSSRGAEEQHMQQQPLSLSEYPSIALSEVLPPADQRPRYLEEGDSVLDSMLGDDMEGEGEEEDRDDFSRQQQQVGLVQEAPQLTRFGALEQHMESSSTFGTDVTANPNQVSKRGGGRRRQDGERLRRAQLQLEEERLYVLRQKEVILRLERSLHKQRAGFLSEASAVRGELQASDEERRRLVSELDRREAVVKAQVRISVHLHGFLSRFLWTDNHFEAAAGVV